jgi:hypothetical protein
VVEEHLRTFGTTCSTPYPKAESDKQVAMELGPGRAIIQDAIVDVAVYGLVFLAASYAFDRIP